MLPTTSPGRALLSSAGALEVKVRDGLVSCWISLRHVADLPMVANCAQNHKVEQVQKMSVRLWLLRPAHCLARQHSADESSIW